MGLLLAFILSLLVGQDNLFGRNTRAVLFIGLVGAGLGAGPVLLAPGNNTRMAEAIAVGVTSPPSRTWIAGQNFHAVWSGYFEDCMHANRGIS